MARGKDLGLQGQVEVYGSWPTPNTPSGGPTKDGGAIPGMNGGKGHREMMKGIFKPGQKLNPRWVETLMGLPIGWTQPSAELDYPSHIGSDNRTDELRLLGNGVVPQSAASSFVMFIEWITEEDKNDED